MVCVQGFYFSFYLGLQEEEEGVPGTVQAQEALEEVLEEVLAVLEEVFPEEAGLLVDGDFFVSD